MMFLIVVLFAVVAAVLFIGTSSPKISELARITYAAAIVAIMLALALGTHDAILRVVR